MKQQKVRFDIFITPEDNRKLIKLAEKAGHSRKGHVEFMIKRAVEDVEDVD